MRNKLSAAMPLVAAILLAFVPPARAVDGTIEINQAKVMAAGGFPYKVTASGSYRLTSNLTLPSVTDAIDLSSANVTIDLNGFSIVGGGGATGLSGSGQSGVTVENGTVTGFGGAVTLGSFAIVKNVHADQNVDFGIGAGNNSVIEGCTASNNLTGDGIACSAACQISGNTANGNQTGIVCTGNGCVISRNTANANNGGTGSGDGINCGGSGCTITSNTAFNNNTVSAIGISCSGSGCLILDNAVANNTEGIFANNSTTGYGSNVISNNTTPVSGGTSMKNNVCSGILC